MKGKHANLSRFHLVVALFLSCVPGFPCLTHWSGIPAPSADPGSDPAGTAAVLTRVQSLWFNRSRCDDGWIKTSGGSASIFISALVKSLLSSPSSPVRAIHSLSPPPLRLLVLLPPCLCSHRPLRASGELFCLIGSIHQQPSGSRLGFRHSHHSGSLFSLRPALAPSSLRNGLFIPANVILK